MEMALHKIIQDTGSLYILSFEACRAWFGVALIINLIDLFLFGIIFQD